MQRWVLLAKNIENPDSQSLDEIVARINGTIIDKRFPYIVRVECPEHSVDGLGPDMGNWMIGPEVSFTI